MTECGGCAGKGSHRRWCPAVVGGLASSYGLMSEQAETMGDRVGANDPGLANRAYAMAGDLRALAERYRDEWRAREGFGAPPPA